MTSEMPDRRLTTRPARRAVSLCFSDQGDLDQIIMPRGGLRLPQKLPFEKWLNIGQQLSTVASSSAWCLGDWLVYGESSYGERYRDAVELTLLDYQTLRNYAWVARKFPLERRRDTLSFGHHAEVAALLEPEQDFWLRKAETWGWSRNRLRREIRASLRERSADSTACTDGLAREPDREEGPAPGGPQIQVSIPPDQFRLCERAARDAGLSVEEWAMAGTCPRGADCGKAMTK